MNPHGFSFQNFSKGRSRYSEVTFCGDFLKLLFEFHAENTFKWVSLGLHGVILAKFSDFKETTDHDCHEQILVNVVFH